MNRSMLEFREIDAASKSIAGGKGAHLVELGRIEGVRVPPGFCVTTDVFERVVNGIAEFDHLIQRLSHVAANQPDEICEISAAIRGQIAAAPIPPDVELEITSAIARIGAELSFAVRSSATAEDLPTASFAGQQDTYLNIVGRASILSHIRRCFASLYTDRAVTYRIRNGFDHRRVRMAVVVQQMVFPDASGILFTADPIWGNRNVSSIDASFGLGEALVSGIVNADMYKVRDGEISERKVAKKEVAIFANPAGGTVEEHLDTSLQQQAALSDSEILRLAELGRRIEAHFGVPQDIEWCLADGVFHIVQSRPITTLFPIPREADKGNHVYLSVGHNQMMSDALKPLGLSFWQMTTPKPMAEAGGRLFVDISQQLSVPASRNALLGMFAKTDPLVTDAVQSLLDRGFIQTVPEVEPSSATPGAVPYAANSAKAPHIAAPPAAAAPPALEADPDIVSGLIARANASIAKAKQDIQGKAGTALLEFIRDDIRELRRVMSDAESHRVVMAGFEATWWLNEHLLEWLGEKNAADALAQSAPNNITSEMGLALLNVADVVRSHPQVVAFLERTDAAGDAPTSFLQRLESFEGGDEVRAAIDAWLEKYGMRGVGEIDITRPRWSDNPAALVPTLLGNVRNFADGAAATRLAQGLKEFQRKEDELLQRLRELPDGEHKALEAKRMIERVRTFVGYREFPKYSMISRYGIYRQALMGEANRLTELGILNERDDIFFLRFEELDKVFETRHADAELIRERREAFAYFETLKPPRVLTSEGEMLNGSFHRDGLPPGALVGLPVSRGTVEGRARIVLDMSKARLEPGDILVTTFTDPAWTPLFVSIAGLVTDVGGLMTHGAVIAREYGLPAVVGVGNATGRIRDGQRIRLHGAEGYVELLE